MRAAAPWRPRRERGWSLVEAVVVVMLMGFTAAGLWKTMELVKGNESGEQTSDLVERAQYALQGRLMRDHVLPSPVDAAPSPGRPNHVEGWLPVDVMGSEPPRRIRYVVDRALLTPPSPLYQSDPMKLLSEGELAPRTSANGLDACMRLIQRETANVSTSGGFRVAFGVQTRAVAGSAGTSAQEFVLENPLAAKPGTAEQISTRAVGYTELVHQLGCFPAFARLATEVKAAVLATDLQDQADLNVKLHDLLVRATRESIVNATWRIVNASIRLAVSTWNTAQALVTTATTPLGLATAAGTLASFAVEATLWGSLLKLSGESLAANKAALPVAEAAQVAAQNYAAEMARQRAWHLGLAAAFQRQGVMP
ncbi:hypothetical protein [Hydrogenophaga sp.]|uniref:hypothetical protein n=1 Tax=Hydrogenophaga sp. TaxID=1904254 RepID=UPI003F70C193